MNKNTINIYSYIEATKSEGPGVRFCIWFQGCLKRCIGCCNTKLLKIEKKNILLIDEICQKILNAKEKYNIEGVTFLGGEPILQIYGLINIANYVKSLGLTNIVFSGYYKSELEKMLPNEIDTLFKIIDVLIDGPFEINNLDKKRRWIGSSNQNIHFFTNNYSIKDFEGKLSSLEIRLKDKELIINGYPLKKGIIK
ncbi:4Fe-4S single cluster domain-containing protein [Streptobacillus canis]|uniref:4Fe-4S single cluster domain-containing protein n=1 Tax=Streptobacillus canis TaxID=2678686 RepID=UPI0012E1E531|nr:4Fe-4S single cluster domain-containing protein [Streptobacillus canis]